MYYVFFHDNLHDILCMMVNERIFLRCGVTTVRYVHQNFTDSWLVTSVKTTRLERETINFPRDPVYMLNEEEDDEELQDAIVGRKRKLSEQEKAKDDGPVKKARRGRRQRPGLEDMENDISIRKSDVE